MKRKFCPRQFKCLVNNKTNFINADLIQKNILLTAVLSPPLSGSLWHYSDPSKAAVKRLRAALHQCVETLDSYYVKLTVFPLFLLVHKTEGLSIVRI